jgi:phage protein D
MTDLLRNPEPLFQVDGQPAGQLTADAQSLRVEETTQGLRSLTLVLLAQSDAEAQDDGLLYLDGRLLDFGKALEVSLGAEGEARTVFQGKVSAVEAGFSEGRLPLVTVMAEDALMRLRFSRRCRTYEKKSDAEIAREVAGLHGLDAQATAEGPTYDYVQQWNQSDLAFLRHRARMVEAELWAEGDTLHFQQRTQREGTRLTLTRGVELMDVQLRADTASQRTRVAVSGYDAARKEAIDRQAGVDVIASETSSERTGPNLLPAVSGEERPSFRVRDVPLTDAEALAFARAEQQRRARRFIVATGKTSGTPDLRVGSRLTLQRVGRPFNGAGYYVTRLCHTWERGGAFRTHFEAERPALGSA